MHKRIENIIDKWYLKEPALYHIYVTHNMESNDRLSCVMRCGKGKIEYNPILASKLDDEILELYLKAEIIRILLKHPYDRQPDGCRKEAIAVGSNLVLGDNYTEFKHLKFPTPAQYNLESSESFECYSYRMEKLLPYTENIDSIVEEFSVDDLSKSNEDKDDNEGKQEMDSQGTNSQENKEQIEDLNKESIEEQPETLVDIITMPDGTEIPIFMSIPVEKSEGKESGDETQNKDAEAGATPSPNATDFSNSIKANSAKANFDLSSLWEEDYTKTCEIESQIEIINNTTGWGSLSGNLVQEILAQTNARIDYRKVLSGFRASVLSSKRGLTRMRPNRRTGFDNLGSIRRFNTNILIAVDVSGSVNDESLRHFFSIINRTFKYGIEKLDVLQFDTIIKSVDTLEKKQIKVSINGRGGTNFQVVFDYAAEHPEYDGLIIFTDGYADTPNTSPKMKCKVAWVCNCKRGYDENRFWMQQLGRCCLMEV